MAVYVPNTSAEQQAMLQECGFADIRDMYRDVPDSVYLTELLDLPEGAPELPVRRKIEAMAAKNHVFPHIFRGAGAYNHYIPSIVHTITGGVQDRVHAVSGGDQPGRAAIHL